MEFMTADIRRRCMEAWERAVEMEPMAAFLFGPPSWLVLEGQKVGESFLEAVERVKGEWFGDRGHSAVDKSKTVDKTVDIAETVDNDRGQLCDCGHLVAPQRKKCWACYKRGRRADDG